VKSIAFSKIRSIIIIIALCILSAGVGYRFGERQAKIVLTSDKRIVVNQKSPPSLSVDFSLFWDVWQRLYRSYVDKSALKPQEMVWGAISGMVNALDDPYTMFLPPKDNKDFKDDLGGQFEGIGAQLDMKDGHIIVVTPLKDSPAQDAGLKPMDIILKVNDEDASDWTVAKAVSKIRGPKGTTVTLTIIHENTTKPLSIPIVRSTIKLPSVESWVKEISSIQEILGIPSRNTLIHKGGMIAYIALSRFGDHTNEDWSQAVMKLAKKYAENPLIKGLVFDLRNNPGGYLESSVFIASEFIKSGTIVSQVNSDGTRQDYPVEHKGQLLTIPLVVLINKGSASAAEITAGALRDHKRATLVGEVSFGKGSVQTPEDLPGGAGLHITTGKWLLPNGDSINKKGVTPDVIISMENATATTDAQLAKAIEILLQ
jgi:carboxyl-terminal processing protease